MEMFKSRSANFAVIRAIIVEASKCTEIDVLRDLEELVYDHVLQFDFSPCEIKEIYWLTASHTSGVFANFISIISRNKNMHKEAYYTAYKFALSLYDDGKIDEVELRGILQDLYNNPATDTNTRNQINAHLVLAA